MNALQNLKWVEFASFDPNDNLHYVKIPLKVSRCGEHSKAIEHKTHQYKLAEKVIDFDHFFW